MEERELKSWCEFEEELQKLSAQRSLLRGENTTYVSPLLFRGQPNATWNLQTTLQRYSGKEETEAHDYFCIATASDHRSKHTQQEAGVCDLPT